MVEQKFNFATEMTFLHWPAIEAFFTCTILVSSICEINLRVRVVHKYFGVPSVLILVTYYIAIITIFILLIGELEFGVWIFRVNFTSTQDAHLSG